MDPEEEDDAVPLPPAPGRSEPPLPADLPPVSNSRPGSGYPPTGPRRINSSGSLRAGSAGAGDATSGMTRSSSTGSVRGAGGREVLQPIPGRPLPAPTGALDAQGQSSNVPRLAPLPDRPGSGGRPASGGSSAGRSTARIGVPPLPIGAAQDAAALPPTFGVPAPPLPHPVGREPLPSVENALTPKGPVKWVPHTHANPKHAKFCFICLHGKMDPHKSEFEDQQRQQQLDDADLPSSLEMKELAYLLPAEGHFRRAGADFTRNNLTAQWIRDISDRLYDETCVNAVAEHNEYLGYGRDTGLINDDEEEQDKITLLKLFTMSEEERGELGQKLDFLGTWCTAQEERLQNVLPTPKVRNLPDVQPLTDEQTLMLDYHPLIDASRLKGDTSRVAREAVEDSEKIGTGSFRVEDLPLAATHADMPEFEIKQFPLTTKDVPAYEPMKPSRPKQRPLEACLDPFQRPSLFLPEFRETLMPDFGNSWDLPECSSMPIVLPEKEWLSTTLSIWPDNNAGIEPSQPRSPSRQNQQNQERKDEYHWGRMEPQSRPVVPFIDEPVLPPMNLEKSSTGEKKILVRSVWDPELFTTEGTMIPPLHARAVAQYMKPRLEVIDHPKWSEQLCPSKPRDAKIREQLPIVPIRSFARFRPRDLDIEIPDWLWEIVRSDPSGQTIWDVIVQRHAIPQEVAKDRQALEDLRKKQEEDEVEALTQAHAEVHGRSPVEMAALPHMDEVQALTNVHTFNVHTFDVYTEPHGQTRPTAGRTLTGQATTSIMRPEPPSFAEPIDEQSRAELPKALQGGAAMGERQEGMRAQAMATTVSDVNTFTQEKMRGDCYVRLIIKPEANAARKDPVPFSAQTMEPDSSLAAKPGRPFAGVPPPAPVLDSTGELIERDDEFADFEKSSAVLFSFVRHNRYEAVEALVQEDHTIVHKSADEHGNSLLHIACQNKNKRIARLLIKNGLSTNVQNNKGNTPLHYCYQYGFTELAEYLIQNGADDQLPNYDGRQPHQGIGQQADAMAQAQRNLRTM